MFQKINGLAGKWVYLDSPAIFFAKYLGYILAGLVILLFLRKWKIIFQAFLAAVLARFAIVEIIRWLWEKPRPFAENEVNLPLEHSPDASFPSGHAAFFFALSFIVYKYNKKAGIGFFFASFLISISRVFTGVHWPLDILAGAVVGIFSGWLTSKLLTRQ